MAGVAAGQLTAFTLGAVFLAWYLVSGRSRLTLNFAGLQIPARHVLRHSQGRRGVLPVAAADRADGADLHQNPAPATAPRRCAGYGMGSRLEFLLHADRLCFRCRLGADGRHGDGRGLVTRARQVAWTAGAAAAITVGTIGLIVAAMPFLWVSMFTSDPGVTAAASSYLMLAGRLFAFFGLGACLYFSSQGAAKVGGPVMAGTARLLIVAGGGWWLASTGAPASALFALVGVAMVVYGLGTALSIRLTRWGE